MCVHMLARVRGQFTWLPLFSTLLFEAEPLTGPGKTRKAVSSCLHLPSSNMLPHVCQASTLPTESAPSVPGAFINYAVHSVHSSFSKRLNFCSFRSYSPSIILVPTDASSLFVWLSHGTLKRFSTNIYVLFYYFDIANFTTPIFEDTMCCMTYFSNNNYKPSSMCIFLIFWHY